MQTALYLALDKRCLVLSSKNGKSPQTIPLADFTLLLSTTDEYGLLQPLRDRCRLVLRFEFYSVEELTTVLLQRTDLQADLHSISLLEHPRRIVASDRQSITRNTTIGAKTSSKLSRCGTQSGRNNHHRSSPETSLPIGTTSRRFGAWSNGAKVRSDSRRWKRTVERDLVNVRATSTHRFASHRAVFDSCSNSDKGRPRKASTNC